MADLTVIEDSVTEINSLLEEVSAKLARVKKAKNLNPSQRGDEVNFMKGRLDRSKKALKGMRVEIREMSKVEQKPHNERAQQLEDKINQLLLDVEWFEKDEPVPADCMYYYSCSLFLHTTK